MTRLQDDAGRIEQLETIEAVWQSTLAALKRAGLDYVIYVTIGRDGTQPFVLTNVPAVYEPNDIADDPFLSHCCNSYDITKTGPAFLADYAYLDDKARTFIRQASQTGWRTGLGIPMRLIGSQRYGGFNIGSALDREAFEKRIAPRAEELRFFCLLIHRRIEEILGNRAGAPSETFRDLLVAPENPALTELSPREREVIYLVARGISRKECARLCGISPNTVAEYAKSAYRKLGVQNRVEVARLVMDRAG